jgi:hypothetical protein
MAWFDRTPYPGLRPFTREESDLFFGRDGCVDKMLDRLASTHFLAVLGSSGTGKSSLVETGLLSSLDMGLLPGAGSRWRIVDFQPRGAPLRNLARRLLETEQVAESVPVPIDDVAVGLLRTRLKREPESILRWCEEGHVPKGTSLLLLVDQFEELFRYENYAGREEAEAFVARLLEVKEAFGTEGQQIPAYVAITMRSEYLGACALIEGLAEAINEGAFLTPRMTREECRQAIEGPAKVCGIEIEERLIHRLLNDLADFASWEDGTGQSQLNRVDEQDQLSRLARRADQLPLMQHALNRMWEEAKNKTSIKLTLSDYESIGGLQGALDKHADQILEQLEVKLGKERSQTITETVFRAVTSGTTAADAVRYPRFFGTLVKLCGDEEGVTTVVNAFRAADCNFLGPDLSVPLLPDTHIDISHESLIRQWSRLSNWLVQEARSSQFWHRLVDAAASYRRGDGGLLEGRSLETIASWRATAKPSDTWAARYGGDYADAIKFLDESIEARDRATRTRVIVGVGTAVLATLALVAAATVVFLLIDTSRKESERQLLAQRTMQDRARTALDSVAAKVRITQAAGDWNSAGNLLSHTIGEMDSGLDTSAASTLYLREIEQYVRANRTAISELKLDSVLVKELDTARGDHRAAFATRFGLWGSSLGYVPRLYLLDNATGAVLARSPEFRDPPRTSEKQKDTVRHYLSPDGQRAVVVLKSGTIIDWDIQKNELNEIAFDPSSLYAVKEKVKTNTFATQDILSVAFDRRTNKVAVIAATEGYKPRIVVSNGNDGFSFQVDVQSLSDQIGNQTAPDDFSSAELIGFSGDYLVAAVHHERRPDGIFLLSSKTGRVDALFSWIEIQSGSQITPDGRAILTAALGLDSDKSCQPTAPDLSAASVNDEKDAHERPGMCMVVLDVESKHGTKVAQLAPGTEIIDVSSTDVVGHAIQASYDVLLQVAGTYRALRVLKAGDGAYSIQAESDTNNTWKAGTAPNTLPFHSKWPLPLRLGQSLTALSRSGKVVVAVDLTDDRDLVLTITTYEDGRSAIAALTADSKENARSFALKSLGLDTAIAGHLGGALEGDGRALFLVLNSRARDDSQMFGAYVDLQGTNASDRTANWMPIELNAGDCRRGEDIRFKDIRYWGRQRLDSANSSQISTFIGIDDIDQLWKLSAETDRANPKIALNCLGRLFGVPQIFDADGDLGLAVVQSESTYLYSLSNTFGSPKSYFQSVLDLPEIPQAAVLFLRSKIALAMKNGDIWIAESRPEWTAERILTGAVSSASALVADQQHLLVTAANGFALSLVYGEGHLTPVGAVRLPISETGFSRLSLDSARSAVRVIEQGTIDTYYLQAPPMGEDMKILTASRGAVVPRSEREWIDILMRFSSAGTQAGVRYSPLKSLDITAKCRLTIDALLALEELEFVDKKPPVWRRGKLKSAAAHSCIGTQSNAPIDNAAQSDGSGDSIARVIIRVVEKLHDETDSWPSDWSLLLQAADRGDDAALRTFLLALNSSKSTAVQNVVKSLWRLLEKRGLFVANEQIQLCLFGQTIEGLNKGWLEGRGDVVSADKQMILGCLSERAQSNIGNRSKALLHFWLAEEFYGFAGREEDEATASARRAAIARTLSDEEIQAARRELASWHVDVRPAPAVVANPVSEGESERLSRDIDRLQSVDEKLSQEHTLTPLRAVLLWTLAEMQSADHKALARQNYRRAVELLENVFDGPLLSRESLKEWSSKLANFQENELAARVLIKAMASFKRDRGYIADEADLKDYRFVISALGEAVTNDHKVRTDLSTLLRFDPFLFGYNSIGRNDPELRTAAREALEEILKLTDTVLPTANENANWRIQRGVTQFWLGVIASDSAYRDSPSGTQAAQFKAAAAQYFGAAMTDFKLAEAREGSNIDIAFMQAEVLRFSGDRRQDVDKFDQAAKKYEAVIVAAESKAWNSPVSLGTLLSDYADVLNDLAYQAFAFVQNIPKFDEVRKTDVEAEFLARVWNSIDSSQRWELARKRAEAASKSDSWGPFASLGFGYAIAALNGHVRLIGDPRRNAVPACDRLASSSADPLREYSGTTAFARDLESAKSDCEEALSSHPNDPHYMFMVARVADDLRLAISAANAGYAAGFNSIAFLIENSNGYKREGGNSYGPIHSLDYKMRQAYTQRVLLVSFAIVYPYLKRDASDERRRSLLQWVATQAANIGMPEGHLALAELVEPNFDRWIHLQLAARLVRQDRVLGKTADELRDMAGQISLSDKERQKAQEAVDTWPASEPLIEIPSTLFEEVQEARGLAN